MFCVLNNRFKTNLHETQTAVILQRLVLKMPARHRSVVKLIMCLWKSEVLFLEFF